MFITILSSTSFLQMLEARENPLASVLFIARTELEMNFLPPFCFFQMLCFYVSCTE